jgi:hypothetical protein
MKITKAQLRNIIKEELTSEIRQAATGTEDEVRAEIDEILTDAGMTPMDALVVLAQQGVIDVVLDLGRFLKQ